MQYMNKTKAINIYGWLMKELLLTQNCLTTVIITLVTYNLYKILNSVFVTIISEEVAVNKDMIQIVMIIVAMIVVVLTTIERVVKISKVYGKVKFWSLLVRHLLYVGATTLIVVILNNKIDVMSYIL